MLEILNIEADQSDAGALKSENKEITHEIFDLHDQVKLLQDKLAEIREDSIWDGSFLASKSCQLHLSLLGFEVAQISTTEQN